MAQYNDTKFYWLQLKEDFFEEDAIEWLESQDNGEAYALFYLKLCLKSLKSNGLLYKKVGDMLMPYDAKMLARLTHTKIDTVKAAMVYLQQAGLIKFLENGEIYIAQVEKMIGSQSISAFKKQQQRMLRAEKQKALPAKSTTKGIEWTNGGQKVDKCPPDIEIEKEKELDKEIEKEKEIETEKEKPADSYEPTGKGFTPQDEQIAEQFNYMCPSFKKVGKLTKKQKDALSFLLEKYQGDLKIFKRAFFLFERHEFLKSKADDWACFNWLIKPEHFEDVLKGRIKGFNPIETKATEAHRPTQEELEAQLMAEGSFKGWDELKQAFNITDDEGETPTC